VLGTRSGVLVLSIWVGSQCIGVQVCLVIVLSFVVCGVLFYPDLNPKLNPPYISTIIETLNSKTILSRALAPRPVCLAPRPCLGTKADRV
jgi:hypothetical protein